MTTDELWDTYAGARIECEVDGRPCRLRGPSPDPLPGPAPIFVMTAYNPGGEERDQAANDADEAVLEAELRSLGLHYWPAVGSSPDASWSEPGVAVAGLDRSRACDFGNRYGQLAVYELDADHVHVVQCTDGRLVRTRDRAL